MPVADILIARVRYVAWTIPALAIVLAAPYAEAHKGMKSPYTYNDHVFPILRDRCGACHFDGGPTPMSLLSYDAALPWAEAIREQLVRETMPPSYVNPMGPAAKDVSALSASELDVLMMWASGGAPEGEATSKPASPPTRPEWKLGRPDLIVETSAEHVVPADIREETSSFLLSTGLTETKWVRAVDLLPGARLMVRDAVVQIEGGPVLTVWGPGYDATPASSGAAFRLPAGAKLRLSIHYKKDYRDKEIVGSDRSRIGLYFTRPPASGHGIQSVALQAEDEPGDHSGHSPLAARLGHRGQVVAITPIIDRPYASVSVDAVLPTGRQPLLLLRSPRPEWPRRYWLSVPIELPPDAKIEATGTLAETEAHEGQLAEERALQVTIDFLER